MRKPTDRHSRRLALFRCRRLVGEVGRLLCAGRNRPTGQGGRYSFCTKAEVPGRRRDRLRTTGFQSPTRANVAFATPSDGSGTIRLSRATPWIARHDVGAQLFVQGGPLVGPSHNFRDNFRIDDVVDGPDALGLDPRSSSASSGTRARRRDSESSGERFKVQFRTRALIPASYRDRRQVLLPCPRTLPESRRCLRPGARMPHCGAGRRIVLAVAGCPGGLVRGRTARPRLGAQAGTASAVSRRVAAARSLALTTQNASTTAGSNCVPEQRRSSVSASLALRPAL